METDNFGPTSNMAEKFWCSHRGYSHWRRVFSRQFCDLPLFCKGVVQTFFLIFTRQQTWQTSHWAYLCLRTLARWTRASACVWHSCSPSMRRTCLLYHGVDTSMIWINMSQWKMSFVENHPNRIWIWFVPDTMSPSKRIQTLSELLNVSPYLFWLAWLRGGCWQFLLTPSPQGSKGQGQILMADFLPQVVFNTNLRDSDFSSLGQAPRVWPLLKVPPFLPYFILYFQNYSYISKLSFEHLSAVKYKYLTFFGLSFLLVS